MAEVPKPCIHSMLVNDCASCWHGAYLRAVTRMKELRSELVVALEDIAGWGSYASDYFKEKWDLDGDIARIKATLARDEGISW